MGKGIHPGCSSQSGRHSDHEYRIIDGNSRCNPGGCEDHLHMDVGIGDDGKTGHLAGSAGRSVDGNKGRQWIGYGVDAGEVADIAGIGRDNADPFGAVMGAAATKANKHVAVVILVDFQASTNIQVSRIRLRSPEDYRRNTCVLQQLLHLVGHTHLDHSFVGNEQSFRAAKEICRCSKLLDGADAHFRYCWNKEIKNLIC